jgi:O-antigen/teichoic acid export membrane protein
MFTSNMVSVLNELLLPFVFLHTYGTVLYADWIVLSAAVAYLSNLNFGMQTFINQDLAVRYGRGEREGYHTQQSTALRMLLGIVVIAAILCLSVFVMPVERWLGLSLSHAATAWTLYFIALQILLGNLLFSYFAGNFMGVGMAHRGTHWGNAQRLCTTLLLSGLAFLHLPFPVLAASQFFLYLLFTVALLIDLRRVAPDIFPSLKYWDRSAVSAILKPSGYFGLIFWSTFLSFQLPVLLLQKLAGPTAVVIFTIGRKIFGMGRQVLNGMTQSMGPEITRLYGTGDWTALSKLYDYSERFIFFLVTVGNSAILFISPLVLLLWLHRPNLFQVWPYVLLCAINIVLCVKEHKYQFQFSTNTHTELAKVMFFGYLVLAGLAIVGIRQAGLTGFLWAWLAVELVQTVFIFSMNRRLFEGRVAAVTADSTYGLLLAAISVCALAAGAIMLPRSFAWGYAQRIAVDILMTATVAATAFLVFRMQGISGDLRKRIQGRIGARA